jgi:hypothetical protein
MHEDAPGSGARGTGSAAQHTIPGEDAERIRLVRGRPAAAVLIGAPIAVVVVLIVGGFYLDDPMYATGLGAVLVGFVVFGVLVGRAPWAFERLVDSGVVRPSDVTTYRAFLCRETETMNHRRQLFGAVGGAVAGFARFPIQAAPFGGLLGDGPASLFRASPLRLADIAAETVLGAIAGLVLWRILILGVTIFRLGRTFDLQLKLNHPDGCGGFRPLGDVCLISASVLSVPAVFLGFWIAVAPRTDLYRSLYLEQHVVFLGITVVLAFAAFLVPLWTIHEEMVQEAGRLGREVDKVAEQIDRLSRTLLDRSAKLSADEAAAVAKDLEVRQATYQRIQRIPTWPIDLRLALRFGTSQLVPLLSLTGLSGPIVDAIGRLAMFASPS